MLTLCSTSLFWYQATTSVQLMTVFSSVRQSSSALTRSGAELVAGMALTSCQRQQRTWWSGSGPS